MSIIIKSTIVFPRGTYLCLVFIIQIIVYDIYPCRHTKMWNYFTGSNKTSRRRPQFKDAEWTPGNYSLKVIHLKMYLRIKSFTIMTSKFNYYITASSFLGISSQLCPISFRSPNCHVNFYGWNRSSSDQRQTVLVVSQILERIIDFVEISGVFYR